MLRLSRGFLAGLVGAALFPAAVVHGSPGVFLTPLNLAEGLESRSVAVTLLNSSGTRYTSHAYSASGEGMVATIPITPEQLVAKATADDLNGKGADEIVSLEVTLDGWVVAKVKDELTAKLLNKISFDSAYRPRWLRVAQEVGADRIPAIAVISLHQNGTPRAKLRDELSGEPVSRVFFDRNFTALHFNVLADINGNGVSELVVVGIDGVGRVRTPVKDARTTALVSMVWFGSAAGLREEIS